MSKTYYVTRWDRENGARRSSDMRNFSTIKEARADLSRNDFHHDSGNAVTGQEEVWLRPAGGDYSEPAASIEIRNS